MGWSNAALKPVEQRRDERFADLVDQAFIRFRGHEIPVPVLNISSRGTQVACDIQPRLGETVSIRFPDCSPMQAFVRWHRDGCLGLRFGHEIILGG